MNPSSLRRLLFRASRSRPQETETSAAAPGAATEPAAPSLLVNYSSDSEEEAPETATKRPRAE